MNEMMPHLIRTSLAVVLTLIPSTIGLSSAMVEFEDWFRSRQSIAYEQATPSLLADSSEQQPTQLHYDRWQEARHLLQQHEPENAIALARELPRTHPWEERRKTIIQTAKTELRRTKLCQFASLGFAYCYSSNQGQG